MIVPQTRFLFWFMVIALPFSALGALYPAAAPIAWCLILGVLVVAIVDGGLATNRLDGISVEFPAVARLSKDRPASLPLVVRNEHQLARRVRIGVPLPDELTSRREEFFVQLPAGAECAQVDWPCLPVRRGRGEIRRTLLEASSPLGFWALRKSVPARCEIRVYPNLLSERKNLAALFLNRGAFGLHAQRQLGKGRDFEKLREYVPGDSFDEIHWKATARRGHPITKVFQIERTQEVYVVLDTSRLAGRPVSQPRADANDAALAGSGPAVAPGAALLEPAAVPGIAAAAATEVTPVTTLERFITAALVLGQAAEHQGDLFGLITFADQVQTFLRARNGREHYNICRDALYTLEASPVTPDFDEIAAFIRTRLRRRALLIVLTALDDPVLAEGFVRNMALLAGQHLVLVNMVQPPGVHPLFTQPDVETIDDLYRQLGGHFRWHNLRELQMVLQRRGVRFSLLANERLAVDLVSQYIDVKQRQLL
jgi:uncharacterized protein (DUF58 family)